MTITLPTEKSTIDARFCKQKFAMIGAAGTGKSEFWAQCDKVLFLELEAGLNFLNVFKVPVRSWDDLREVYGLLTDAAKKKADANGELGFPYELVVIDTVDRLVDLASEEVIKQAQEYFKRKEINTIRDIPEGAGWDTLRKYVNTFLRKMEVLPCAIAYIGHVNNTSVITELGEYHLSTISIGGKLGGDLLAWADHILHVEAVRKGEKLHRLIWTKPTQSKEAKSRGAVIPDGWVWKDDMKENWQYFRKLFK